MNDDPDDPTDDELRALNGDPAPPPELEQRVLSALRAQGLLGPRAGARRRWVAAAALACFAVGWAARDVTARPQSPPDDGPLYLLLLSPLPEDGRAAEEQRVQEYGAWARSLRRENRLVRAEKLGDESRVLGAGPGTAADASGVFLIRAASMDAAMAVARECPHLRHGGSITIRGVDRR
jgi:hypothetical protein